MGLSSLIYRDTRVALSLARLDSIGNDIIDSDRLWRIRRDYKSCRILYGALGLAVESDCFVKIY